MVQFICIDKKFTRQCWINSAAPLAHLGVGIMLIGIVGSGYFSESQRMALTENEVVNAMGYDLVYKGMEKSSDGKSIAEIHVSDANNNYVFKPRLFPTKYNEGMMREPDVKPGIISDLYISPLEERTTHEHNAEGHSFSLVKGQTTEESGYKITFVSFNMQSHEGGGHMRVGADLKVEINNQTYDISPAMIMGEQGREMAPAKLPVLSESANKKTPLIFLSALNADTKQITLAIQGVEEKTEEHTSQLIIEFSKKPFMGILWLGTILLTLGTIVAFIKRVKME